MYLFGSVISQSSLKDNIILPLLQGGIFVSSIVFLITNGECPGCLVDWIVTYLSRNVKVDVVLRSTLWIFELRIKIGWKVLVAISHLQNYDLISTGKKKIAIIKGFQTDAVLLQYEVWLRGDHWFKERKQIGSNYQMVISVNCRNADPLG